MILDGRLVCTWQFFVTFFGWLSDLLNPLKGVKRPPPIGDEKVTTFESFGLNIPIVPWILWDSHLRSSKESLPYPPTGGETVQFSRTYFSKKKGLLQPPTRFLIPKLSNIHLPSITRHFRYLKWRNPHLYKLYGYGLCKGVHPSPKWPAMRFRKPSILGT